MLPLPTIPRAVSGSVNIIAANEIPEAIHKNQKIHLQPARAPRIPPKIGPILGAVVILNGLMSLTKSM